MKAEELDKKFDVGEDIIDNLDLRKAKRPGLKTKRVSVDFTTWMVPILSFSQSSVGFCNT